MVGRSFTHATHHHHICVCVGVHPEELARIEALRKARLPLNEQVTSRPILSHHSVLVARLCICAYFEPPPHRTLVTTNHHEYDMQQIKQLEDRGVVGAPDAVVQRIKGPENDWRSVGRAIRDVVIEGLGTFCPLLVVCSCVLRYTLRWLMDRHLLSHIHHQGATRTMMRTWMRWWCD